MLEIRGVTKTYRTKKGGETHALRGVTLAFPARGLVFLLGKSGSGKSTLLNILGGLDRPDAGELIAYGRSSAHFTEEDFDSYRNTCVGFIFQEYNLLDEFTVEENVALALELQGMKRGTDDARRPALPTHKRAKAPPRAFGAAPPCSAAFCSRSCFSCQTCCA